MSSFFPKITFPTRFSEHRGTLIDNFLCKLTNNFFEATAGIIVANISDHLPYFLCIGNVKAKYIVPKYIGILYRILMKTKRHNIYMTELTNSGVYDKLNHHKDGNPNDNYNILHNMLSDIGAKCMQTKKVKINKHKHKKSKWITQGIIRSITFRDKLYLKMKLSPKDTAEYIKINLKTYNNILKRNIRQAKILYYQHQFDQYKNNIKKTWGVIKELVNRRPMKIYCLNTSSLTEKYSQTST